MSKKMLDLGPFGVYLWGGILLASGLVYAGGAALTANNYGTIYPKQLANGTPGVGKYPRGGACQTGTSIDTSVGTTDRQCWSKIPASDVEGVEPAIPAGQPGKAVCYSGTGTATTTNKGACSFSTFTGGTIYAGSNVALSTGTNTTLGTSADLGSSPKVHVIGVEPSLPACAPGQAVVYTGTGTGTSTAKGCGTVATVGNGFDPLGTYFLHTCEGPCFLRWGTFSPSTAVTSSATCSTGSDALIAEFFASETSDFENRILWPGGYWLAKLNAKVNANGAAIRIEVWDTDGAGGYSQWFNWTTDAFANTAFAVIQKPAQATERVVASREHRVFFRLYATCSTSTTVTLQYADGSSIIESPMAKEAAPTISDVDGLTAALSQKEAVISGTPGKFVKFAGTGTSVTTSKEAAYPGISSRSSFVQSLNFTVLSSGATAYTASTYSGILLADGATQTANGAFFLVPKDAASTTLTVRPIWIPRANDATSHSVRWTVSYLVMVPGESVGGTMTDVTFTGDSAARTANRYTIETGASITASAGDVVKLAVSRIGADGADTYVGDIALLALKIDYVSSI